MYKILTSIIAPLTNFRQKDVDAFTQTQIDYVKSTCIGDMTTTQITK